MNKGPTPLPTALPGLLPQGGSSSLGFPPYNRFEFKNRQENHLRRIGARRASPFLFRGEAMKKLITLGVAWVSPL